MTMREEMHEAKKDLLNFLGIDSDHHSSSLEMLADGESKFIRDTKVNLKNTLRSAHLSEKETALIALAVAVNERNEVLKDAFARRAREHGASEQELGETYANASLLAVNNVFYRFRHFASNKSYENLPARVKMTLMMNPVLGKEFFELVSLVVSAVNGCEACVNAHEHSVRELGATEERIFDAVRLGAVVHGLCSLVH